MVVRPAADAVSTAAVALPRPAQDLPSTRVRIGPGWVRRLAEVGMFPDEFYRNFTTPDPTPDEQKRLGAMNHYFMGQYYLTMEEPAHALGEFRAALDEAPGEMSIKLGIVEAELAKRDHEEALTVIADILRQEPDNVQALILRGKLQSQMAQEGTGPRRRELLEQAVASFGDARRVQPKNLEVLNGLASVYVALQNVDKMVETYRDILAADPRNTRAMLILAQILSRTGKPDEAIGFYERVIEQRRGFVNTYMYLGQLYEELGRTDQAIATYKSAILIEPRNQQLQKLFEDVVRKLARTRGDAEVLRQYEAFAKEYPYSSDVQRIYADQLVAAKDPEGALRQYRRVLELDTENVDAMVAVGNILMNRRSFDEAAKYFARAVDINPEKVDVFDAIAQSYLGKGDRARATTVYQRAIELNPKVDRLYVSLASLYDADDKTTDAQRVLEQGIARIGQRAELLFPLGQVAERQRLFPQAAAYYEKAYVLSPDNRTILMRLLASLIRTGDKVRTDEAITRAASSFRDDRSDYYLLVGETFLAEGEVAQAVQWFEKGIQQSPSKLVLVVRMVRTLNILREFDRSLKLLEDSMPRFPRSDEMQRLQAETYMDKKDYDRAIEIYRRIVAEKPDSLDGYRLLVDALSRAERHDQALEAVRQAEQRIGRSEDVDSMRGIALFQQKRFDAAEKLFKDLARRSSRNADTYHYFLGSIYLEQKRFDLARKSFEKAIELNPTNDSALNALGYMLADLGKDLPMARKLVEQANRLNPGAPHILDSLGWVSFKMGRLDEAREYVERAARLIGEDAEVFEHLGDIYRAQGDTQRAVEYWRKSLQLDKTRVAVEAKIRANEPKVP